jgi:hypothetical protein
MASDLFLEAIYELLGQVVDAVLSVLEILSAQLWHHWQGRSCIPLGELLEGEASVAEDLGCDITLGFNFNAQRGHLKG